MSYTAKQLVDFALSMVGQPYWFGTAVHPCTEALLRSKLVQYPTHYTVTRMAKYHQAVTDKRVCTDCMGLIKGFFWTGGGRGVAEYLRGGPVFVNKYQSNGMADRSANMTLSWCKQQGCDHGVIGTLPERPGVLLFMPGHVGVYIGGGYAVEARGFAYGVVKTAVAGRGWKEWAALPADLIDYGEAKPEPEPVKPQTPAQPERIEAARSFDRSLARAYIVTASALNLRAGPGTDRKILAVLKKGDRATCYGYYTQTATTTWLYVSAAGKVGFVSAKYLQ